MELTFEKIETLGHGVETYRIVPAESTAQRDVLLTATPSAVSENAKSFGDYLRVKLAKTPETWEM